MNKNGFEKSTQTAKLPSKYISLSHDVTYIQVSITSSYFLILTTLHIRTDSMLRNVIMNSVENGRAI